MEFDGKSMDVASSGQKPHEDQMGLAAQPSEDEFTFHSVLPPEETTKLSLSRAKKMTKNARNFGCASGVITAR